MPRPTPPPPSPSDTRGTWPWVAAIMLAAVSIYAWSLHGPFLFDDIPGIVQNESIRDLSDLGRVLHPPTEGSGIDSRPVVNLSLALNYAAGGLAPEGYRAVNLGIHVLAGLALFGFVRRTASLPWAPAGLRPLAIPFAGCVALLWTVHPLQTETVICVIQRTEALVSLFYLAALYGFVRGATPGGHKGWLAATWCACVLGTASKEVMASAPIMLILYDRTFIAGTFREAWRQRARWHLLFATAWLLLAWLVLDSGGNRGGTAGFGHGVSAWSYLLTQAHALTVYLKLSIWPHPLLIDYGDWLAPGLSDVLFEGFLISGLLALTVWALVRRPAAGFVGALFFALLAPSSSFYPLISQTLAEHRMYLPLASVLTLAVAGVFRFPPRVALVSCLTLAVIGGGLSIRRGADYASELRLWTDLVARAPANPWAYFHLGRVHFQAGRLAEAENENRAALALRPGHPESNMALGMILERQGRIAEALTHYLAVLDPRPSDLEAHFRAGQCLLRLTRFEEARAQFAEVVRLNPNHADALGNLGALYFQLGRPRDALPHFARLVELRPDSPLAHYNSALAHESLGNETDASSHFASAARLAPEDPEIQTAFARSLLRNHRYNEAREVLQRTLQRGEFAPARQLLNQLNASAR